MADKAKTSKKDEVTEDVAEVITEETQAKEEVIEVVEQVDSTEESTEETEEPKTAKAGKRSAKAIAEADELAEKEARKERIAAGEEPDPAEEVKKGPVPKVRPLIERRSKAYQKAHETIDQNKDYTLKEAIEAVIKTSTVKFDATAELHVNLNVDPKHADQNIRDSLVLPNGTGKTVRVAVFAPADLHEAAKKAGADVVGEDDFLEQLKKEEINFDVLVATPEVMAKLGKFAKLLGPKGLMPNPKSGTVTKDVSTAVKEAKAGRVEYRVDEQGIIHLGFGKLSFGLDKLVQNAEEIMESVRNNKPNSIKGSYISTIHVTSSMGPSIKVSA